MAYTATLGTSGTTAAFASDVVVLPGVTTAHYPNIKMVWGASSTGTPWSDATPPPVKGSGSTFRITLPTTTGVYTIGDVVGGAFTITPAARTTGGSSIINSITIEGVNANPYELWLWDQDLADAAEADNAVMTIAAVDAPKFLGTIDVLASDYRAPVAAFNYATVKSIGLQVKTTLGPSIIGHLKALLVTSPGTTALNVSIGMEYLD